MNNILAQIQQIISELDAIQNTQPQDENHFKHLEIPKILKSRKN